MHWYSDEPKFDVSIEDVGEYGFEVDGRMVFKGERWEAYEHIYIKENTKVASKVMT